MRRIAVFDTNILFSAEQSIETVADFVAFQRVVPITGQFKAVSADPDDVTGDRRHLLPLGNFQGIAIVTAAEFVKAVMSP
ncbi:MAG TPA: hypothetical protein VF278_12030 [Pirellulales bacterium]